MNILGKIFVFAVFIMSLVFMSFAVAIFASHTNWKDRAEQLDKELADNKNRRGQLLETIDSLQSQVASSEAERDQVVAKLQYALAEQSTELKGLKTERDMLMANEQEAINSLRTAQEELKRVTEKVETLREEVRGQQMMVDNQVSRSVELSAQLHEKQSTLAIVEERKAQLEKQLANARLLLKQNGLSVDSLPRDQVPTIDGVVTAVADGAVEVSLGGDDGLQMGHVLELYRNDQYVGRAVVKAVKPDRAVAVIQKEYARGVVQRGDRVTTRLKAA